MYIKYIQVEVCTVWDMMRYYQHRYFNHIIIIWEKKERKTDKKTKKKERNKYPQKERHWETNKGKKQGHDISSHNNAVHISSPDYRKTHLIAQGICAIKLIITWCIVFFISCFDCFRCANPEASFIFQLVSLILFTYLKKLFRSYSFFSKTPSPPPTNHLLSECQ